MKRILRAGVLAVLVVIACEKESSPSREKSGVQPVPKVMVEREKMERQEPLPPEVKIKLKKDGKDNYSWELNGSDVDQILRVNEKLRKQLGEKAQ